MLYHIAKIPRCLYISKHDFMFFGILNMKTWFREAFLLFSILSCILVFFHVICDKTTTTTTGVFLDQNMILCFLATITWHFGSSNIKTWLQEASLHRHFGSSNMKTWFQEAWLFVKLCCVTWIRIREKKTVECLTEKYANTLWPERQELETE